MLALSLLLLTATPAPLRVAVPDFSVINVSKESAAFFMDRFANRLRSKGLLVTTATEIDAVLGLERQKALLGCSETSTSCQAEIAAALGADAIVRARIARFGERFELALTLIDPVDAGVLASISASAADERKVLDALDQGADELNAKLVAAKRRGSAPAALVTEAPTQGHPHWVSLIPLAVGVGAGIAGTVALGNSFVKRDAIATSEEPRTLAEEAKVDRALGIAFVGLGVAGLATAAILFFTAKAPTARPVVAFSPSGAWVGVEGRLP